MEMLGHLLPWANLEETIRWGGYAVLAIIIFSETGLLIGFFLPGDSLLFTAGFLAGSTGLLDIVWLSLLLCACAILGDAVGYQIGLRMGPRIFKRPKSLLFNPKHLEWTRGFYERHGGKTIVLARFMPIARTFAPVVAGMGRMGYRRFATFNVVGGVAWILSFTLGGYWLARLIPDAQRYLHIVVAVVIFLSILPGIIAYARARWSRPRPVAEPAE